MICGEAATTPRTLNLENRDEGTGVNDDETRNPKGPYPEPFYVNN